MAREFGGKYSPGATGGEPRQDPPDLSRVDAGAGKANVLFIPAVILAATSFGNGPLILVVGLAAAAVLALAAWLLREGLRAEAEYNARKVARRPAMPRKMFATALTGIGIAVAAWTGQSGIIGAVLYGVAAAGLHLAAFGIDPLRDKRMEGVDTFQQDRVAKVVEQAEDHIAAIRTHIGTLGDRALSARVDSFIGAASKLIRTVEEDPRDLTGARKYLSVYLRGASDASAKFAELYRKTADEGARSEYEALLTDLETNFAARTEKMLLNDQDDMEIEIKVLRDRLQREGL